MNLHGLMGHHVGYPTLASMLSHDTSVGAEYAEAGRKSHPSQNRQRRMKRFLIIVGLLLSMSLHGPVLAHETETPHEEINVNVNTPSEQKKVDFRAPPALKPLLLIPLAVGLYLVYERLAKRE